MHKPKQSVKVMTRSHMYNAAGILMAAQIKENPKVHQDA